VEAVTRDSSYTNKDTVRALRELSHILAGSDDRELVQHAADMIEVAYRTTSERAAGSAARPHDDGNAHREQVPSPTSCGDSDETPLKAVPFYQIEWTKEDWIDFWHTLVAFQDRIAERHGVRRKK
jgi:hypothetical protein